MLTYETLKKKPREFLAATGLRDEEFLKLLPAFADAYQKRIAGETTSQQPRQRKPGAGAKGVLSSMEQKLLFILVYTKTNALQTLLGLHFGLSQGQANYWIHYLLGLLQQALADLSMTPERDGSQVATRALSDVAAPAMVIDGVERPRQRAVSGPVQREHYSGKKKTHTDKNILLVDADTRRVVFLSATQPGRKHDKKLADESEIIYRRNTALSKDTGFQGYEPEGVLTQQPKKKSRAKS